MIKLSIATTVTITKLTLRYNTSILKCSLG